MPDTYKDVLSSMDLPHVRSKTDKNVVQCSQLFHFIPDQACKCDYVFQEWDMICVCILSIICSYIIYHKSFILKYHDKNYGFALKVKIQKISILNTMILTLKQDMEQTTLNERSNAYNLTKALICEIQANDS